MTSRVVPLALACAVLSLSPIRSGAAGPWVYAVTGPGGSSVIGPEQIGQVVFFQLDATVPDYVWGNVRVDFDPRLLECVSVEETPYAEGFWTAWVPQAADPAYGGGGVPYLYDVNGLGSDWAAAWVAAYGPGVAGPVASYDNAAGIVRFYAMTNAGGYAGAAPLRIGFRVKAAGTAAFTTSANDWTAFGWPAPAAQPAVTPSADLAATADAATGQGYSWALEDLPYRLVSEVTILAPVRVVAIDVNPGSDAGACGRVRATIPVAVLGAPDLDVAAVDVASVALEGMPVARTGNGRLRASYEDVNGDGAVDLLASIANTRSLSGTIPVRLTGTLVDGTPVEGTDVLCGP